MSTPTTSRMIAMASVATHHSACSIRRPASVSPLDVAEYYRHTSFPLILVTERESSVLRRKSLGPRLRGDDGIQYFGIGHSRIERSAQRLQPLVSPFAPARLEFRRHDLDDRLAERGDVRLDHRHAALAER